jgi:hypothetical protein
MRRKRVVRFGVMRGSSPNPYSESHSHSTRPHQIAYKELIIPKTGILNAQNAAPDAALGLSFPHASARKANEDAPRNLSSAFSNNL